MLSVNDYNHLKLLYEQLLKLNANVKELILAKDWDGLSFLVRDKEALTDKIVKFEKPRVQDIKDNDVLNKTRIKLYELEKENLELVKKIREDMLLEFRNVKKARKVLGAYEPAVGQVISTFEIKSED